MLICTKKAAELTGLSAYELRHGFKQGLYPALEVGRGSRRKSLKAVGDQDDFVFRR